jgi:signal transduction histidine kinase
MPKVLAGRLPGRAWLPRRTVRRRLTLLYGALFLASGAGLLAITYVLVGHAIARDFSYRGPGGAVGAVMGSSHSPAPGTHPQVGSGTGTPLTPQQQALARRLQDLAASQHGQVLHQLLIQSGIALAIMAVLALALGWVVAGRVLLPLRTMTAAARRISQENLHERLALTGPRDELTALGETIDGLLGRLESAFEAQRRFVANASHELRTPLTMMRTALDVATCKPQPPGQEVTSLASKIRKGLDRADLLLEGFLMLARAENGFLGDETTLCLGQAASSALAERSEAIAAMKLTVDQACHDAPVHGSAVLLTRMIENVIDNAVRHNQPGGWIQVTTHADGPQAQLTVETGGRVLDEQQVSKLAQPFRRLGADRTGSGNGTGLGLSIVAAIAAAHDGTLDLHARPQGGLRAVITLPAADRTAVAGAPA